MAGDKKVTLKLLVDKEKNRVVLAEADRDFVDILFSFLALPMGTIVRLLNKQSTVGCLDNIYSSVENLDAKHLRTEACKDMLLFPRSATAFVCEDLKLNIDGVNPRDCYVCRNSDCCAEAICPFSFARNARCPRCQQIMDSIKAWPKREAEGEDGVFIKGEITFMVTEDLCVMPASMMQSLSLAGKLGISDASVLEETTLELGPKEISDLLKLSLISKTPLTDMLLHNKETGNTFIKVDSNEMVQNKLESDSKSTSNKVSVKLLLNTDNNKVLCAEAGGDLVDLVFSFLALPLGSVIQFLATNSSLGCVDKLYRSLQGLSVEYIKSEECRIMLLSPKFASFFVCSNQFFNLEEMPPEESRIGGCRTCYWENGNKECRAKSCRHGVEKSDMKELNPKLAKGGTQTGGGYARGDMKFMVTDDLHVSHLSPISIFYIVCRPELLTNKLVVVEVDLGEAQVLHLLKVALTSRTPLTDLFSPNKKPWKRIHCLV